MLSPPKLPPPASCGQRPIRDPRAHGVHTQSERGIALVAVLWTMVLLSVLAATLVAMSRSDAREAQAEIARFQAGEATKAGITLAIVALLDPQSEWPLDGAPQALKFQGADLEVSVSAESGKIDLNTADPALIAGLLTAVGDSPGDAETTTAAIATRREPDAQGGPSRPFHSLGEIIGLPGMTRDLYDRILPALTLYSGSTSIDPTVASMDVLLAMPGNTRADAEAALAGRTSPAQNTGRAGDLSRIIGHAFTVGAIARMPDGTVARGGEIVRLTGDARHPVWVMAKN